MKELSIEEKVKRYDEAIKVAQRFYNNSAAITKKGLEDIFPELKDSDDEKVRKEILEFFSQFENGELRGVDISSWIAYLEKQGEKGINGKNREIPFADKVEPKFKVGDFIVNDYCMGRIVEITNDAYLLDTEQGIPFSCHSTRLWDIAKDAKDGDVLCSNQIILIFKQWEDNTNCNFVIAHAGIDVSGKLQITDGHWLINNNSKPATKEQRDQLEKAMADAGYTFDFEKKELKKIEQKLAENKGMNIVEEDMTPFQKKVFCIIDTAIEEEQGLKQVCDELLALASNEIEQKPAAWSEEDEKYWSIVIAEFSKCAGKSVSKDEWMRCNDWLNSLKDRVQPQPKQEWGEEDEKYLIYNIEQDYKDKLNNNPSESLRPYYNKVISLLKSIRHQKQWKPSEEQMMYLSEAIDVVTRAEKFSIVTALKELREQLKKLKGE